MRILSYIIKAGLSPHDVIHTKNDDDGKISQVEILKFVRQWVRKKLKETSLVDTNRDLHVAVFGWTELHKEDVDFLEEVCRMKNATVIEVRHSSENEK